MNPEASARHDRASGGAPRARPHLLRLPGGTRPADVERLTAAVRDVLLADRTPGTVLVPAPPGEPLQHGPAVEHRFVRAGTAVLLRTSGSSSGHGKTVALTAGALTSSAHATHERLGGPGRWVLALPAHHVAGLQVVVRAALAGHDPVPFDTSGGFDPLAMADAVARLPQDGSRWYTSLVPTQLSRLLDAGEAAVSPLRRFSAILVGGAALDRRARERAQEAGLAVVATYGMTETGGGCVYDGVPLSGVELAVEEHTGRVRISGPVLAAGYVDDDAAHAEAFVVEDGRRWLRTADRGELGHDGGRQHLRILGRVDDVINTGGVKVAPAEVEAALRETGAETVVVGVPDAEWGEIVTAVVVAGPAGVPSLSRLRAAARRRLPGTHAPRALVALPELPLLGPGKVDRRAAARLAAQRMAEGTGAEVHRPSTGPGR